MKHRYGISAAAMIAAFGAMAVFAQGRDMSTKMTEGHANPLLDFHFTADPTVVEHEGRLYVYATNDHQQYDSVGGEGKNSYEKIKSLVMMSTDDMANWTFHGTIDVESLAPWIIASWAPSIVSRREEDGKTHFYLYFSNSGYGTGVLTSTSPVGPWSSPLGKSLVDADSEGLGDCKVPFDPGAVIDADGKGWLTVGAGKSRIMRLGKDMISIDSEKVPLPAPHHFEANELNFIGDTYVYTYNTDWQPHDDWPYEGEIPSICSMCYMTSRTPLDSASWQYHRPYLKNSGDYGYTYTNNHTHLHKYQGRWYVFYHSMELQNLFHTQGGFRNVCVDEIEVDEPNLDIRMADQTLRGVMQIKTVDPFRLQQAETTSATHGVRFADAGDIPGNMKITPVDQEGCVKVSGVEFTRKPKGLQLTASGGGVVEVRSGSPSGELLASVDVNSANMAIQKKRVKFKPGNTPTDLYFILKGPGLEVDSWKFF